MDRYHLGSPLVNILPSLSTTVWSVVHAALGAKSPSKIRKRQSVDAEGLYLFGVSLSNLVGDRMSWVKVAPGRSRKHCLKPHVFSQVGHLGRRQRLWYSLLTPHTLLGDVNRGRGVLRGSSLDTDTTVHSFFIDPTSPSSRNCRPLREFLSFFFSGLALE